MPPRAIPYLKALVHLACLAPFLWIVQQFRNGSLALNADPVRVITHFTGNWALWILLADLAITPVRRLTPRLAWLIRFRRMVGLYAFFYATLHLSTYIFLFSGFDLPTAWTNLTTGHIGDIGAQWKTVWPTIYADILKRRFIQIGFFAWLILLALALTSPLFMLRAMGGKNWQRLHRLIYVAGIFVAIHYLWLVKPGNREPWPDAFVLAVLLLARVVYFFWKKQTKVVPPRAKGPAATNPVAS